jgi:hypothetical protein
LAHLNGNLTPWLFEYLVFKAVSLFFQRSYARKNRDNVLRKCHWVRVMGYRHRLCMVEGPFNENVPDMVGLHFAFYAMTNQKGDLFWALEL